MPHATVDEVNEPHSNDASEDMELADAPPLEANGEASQGSQNGKHKSQQSDVKLKDLFNDEDSDSDEFSGSSPIDEQNESNSSSVTVYVPRRQTQIRELADGFPDKQRQQLDTLIQRS